MRVRADDEARAAVDEIGQRLLLARGLGVEVDDDGICRLLELAGLEFAVDGAEGIVLFAHEDATDGVDHEHIRAVPGLDERRAATGRPRRHVERTDQTRLATDEDQRLLLVESMVTERHRIGPGIDQLGADRLRNAKAPGRVLAVDGDEIEPQALAQPWQMLKHGSPARPADDIAEEKEAHFRGFRWF